jgi:hypothetical protein
MKAFIFEGKQYIRCIPSKRLFNSTMVEDQILTIIPGLSPVTNLEVDAVEIPPKQTATVRKMRAKLKQMEL